MALWKSIAHMLIFNGQEVTRATCPTYSFHSFSLLEANRSNRLQWDAGTSDSIIPNILMIHLLRARKDPIIPLLG